MNSWTLVSTSLSPDRPKRSMLQMEEISARFFIPGKNILIDDDIVRFAATFENPF
jgi:hypothetical protein